MRIAIYILNLYKLLISIPISKNLRVHLHSIIYITKYAKNSDKLIMNSESQQTNIDRNRRLHTRLNTFICYDTIKKLQ